MLNCVELCIEKWSILRTFFTLLHAHRPSSHVRLEGKSSSVLGVTCLDASPSSGITRESEEQSEGLCWVGAARLPTGLCKKFWRSERHCKPTQ